MSVLTFHPCQIRLLADLRKDLFDLDAAFRERPDKIFVLKCAIKPDCGGVFYLERPALELKKYEMASGQYPPGGQKVILFRGGSRRLLARKGGLVPVGRIAPFQSHRQCRWHGVRPVSCSTVEQLDDE